MHKHPFRSAFPVAGGPVSPEQILAFHRATFGSARMDGGESHIPLAPATTEAPPAGVVTDPPPAPPAPTNPPTATEPGKVEVWQDPDKAKAEIERLRRENGAERTNAKAKAAEDARAELAQTIGKALGLVKDDEQADPAKLTEQLAATRAAQRDTAAELIVWRHAADLQVDAAALTDSRAFAAAIKDLDPASKTFAADVKKAAQEAAEQNPKLKAAPAAAGASTVQHAGGSGEADRTLDAQIEEARKAGKHELAISLQRQKAYGR